jgi:hypothetical protein
MNGGYDFARRALDLGSITAYAALAGLASWRLVAGTHWLFPAVVVFAVPAGWLASDLLSGILHWVLDSFGSASTPLAGPLLIRPFREHHDDPGAIARQDFVAMHGASCFTALPFLGAACALPLEAWPSIIGQALLVFMSLGALFANQCHKWAHMDESATPVPVRWAQANGLVLPREHHRLHHTPPFDSHFCMSSGRMNPFLDGLLRKRR